MYVANVSVRVRVRVWVCVCVCVWECRSTKIKPQMAQLNPICTHFYQQAQGQTHNLFHTSTELQKGKVRAQSMSCFVSSRRRTSLSSSSGTPRWRKGTRLSQHTAVAQMRV